MASWWDECEGCGELFYPESFEESGMEYIDDCQECPHCLWRRVKQTKLDFAGNAS